jgi:DNA-binding transcriptional ArsR family regulator
MSDERRAYAFVFAALADETRLSLVAKLSSGAPRSISQLTDGSKLTRQAITKHLRVLESARVVHSVRTGRESRFEFDPTPIDECKRYLDRVSEQWDLTLSRLKAFVEAKAIDASAGDGVSAKTRATTGPRRC